MDFSTLKGLTIPEGNVTKIVDSLGAILWELKTSRIPSEYQEVEWIQGDSQVAAYLDLGFAFDTKCYIELGYYPSSQYQSISTYLFGTAENSGTKRCMISTPYSGGISWYGTGTSNYVSGTSTCIFDEVNHLTFLLEKGKFHFKNLTSDSGKQLTSQIECSLESNLYLLGQNYNGTRRCGGLRRVYYFRYYDKNDELICDLVPCYRKSDGVIGMYDVVRKIFLTNASNTGAFKKGADVVNTGNIITNWAKYSINADGSIYNNGLGYKTGYRVRSGGEETASDTALCTGYIPLKIGDTLRIYPPFTGKNVSNAINFVNGSFENIGQVTDYGSRYGICTSLNYMPTVIDGASVFTLTEAHDESIAYVRVTHDNGDTLDGVNLIITVNQEIPT